MSGVGFSASSIPFPSCHFLPGKKLHLHEHQRAGGSSMNCCKATRGSSSSITDYDLYDLLGIESSSDQTEIKRAYRALQKRCHPDIAGPAGHDMAIILNDAYSVLSDPISRYGYDKEQAKISEFHGYTGRPLYSSWSGSESENRAVFVDEVKCVGCLKCALFASNTFAVETVYGRARVVSQWADPEERIEDAISACPVDCISYVERSDLAALEFLMSKQPRGDVRPTAGNTGGARVSNIFVDVERFKKRHREMKEKTSKEHHLQWEAKATAMQGIRAMANWFYWRTPENYSGHCTALVINTTTTTTQKSATGQWKHADTERIRKVAADRRDGGRRQPKAAAAGRGYSYEDEYWTPAHVLPRTNTTGGNNPNPEQQQQQPPPSSSSSQPSSSSSSNEDEVVFVDFREENPMSTIVPEVIAVVAMIGVGYAGGGGHAGIRLGEHVGGHVAVDIVNSAGMQILLTGITWYAIGAALMGFVRILGIKN